MVTIEQIKQLRDETGASPVKIKKALEESGEDFEKAKALLKTWGAIKAGEKSTRETGDGIIDFYIHPNAKTGVLLDIRCETDFVAASPEFKKLAHEICLQIAAMKPLFVSDSDIPPEFLDGETKIYEKQAMDSGKTDEIVRQIVEGKLQ